MTKTDFILLCQIGVFALQIALLVLGYLFVRNAPSRLSGEATEAFPKPPKQSVMQKLLNPPLQTGLMKFTEDDINVADLQRERRRRIAVKRQQITHEDGGW